MYLVSLLEENGDAQSTLSSKSCAPLPIFLILICPNAIIKVKPKPNIL